MNRLRVCFEIDGIADDEHGNPGPAGLQLDFGETSETIPYEELVKSINIPGLLKLACLSFVPVSNVRVITPEEYDEKYGED